MIWTDEAIERLRELVAEGWSMSRIGDDLGLSRNAVCGKIHRMKIVVSPKPLVGKVKSGKPERVAPFRPPANLPPPLVVVPPPEEPNSLQLQLLDLVSGQCRYPQGDRDFLFCGHPQREHSSYCAYHHRLTNNPIPPRVR